MANSGWRDIFPNVEVVVEAMPSSDHAALVLQLLGRRLKQSKGSFFFFFVLKPIGLLTRGIKKLS